MIPKFHLFLRCVRRSPILAALLLMLNLASAAEPNTLSPQEAADGWLLHFDGHDVAGWHIYRRGPGTTGGWHVNDGWLTNPKSNGRPNGSGGDLVTDVLYTDFELSFEWRLDAAGNSGVEYLFREDEAKRKGGMYAGDTGDSPMGFEYQILDDPAYASNDSNRLTASLYSLITPVNKTLNPPGQINEGRIILRGTHLEHWLNGRKVLETEVGGAALQGLIARSKFKGLLPNFGVKAPTPIALQDHGCRVEYRNIKIRSLAAASPVPVVAVLAPVTTAPALRQNQPPLVQLNADDWRVWCWSPQHKRWTEHPLGRMSNTLWNGVLSARNTTQSHWPRALLVYRRAAFDGDFTASAEVRGQLESFDLQSVSGENLHVTCTGLPNDSKWHPITFARRGSEFAATIDGKSLNPKSSGQVSEGYLVFKIRPDEQVEVRNLMVRKGR